MPIKPCSTCYKCNRSFLTEKAYEPYLCDDCAESKEVAIIVCDLCSHESVDLVENQHRPCPRCGNRSEIDCGFDDRTGQHSHVFLQASEVSMYCNELQENIRSLKTKLKQPCGWCTNVEFLPACLDLCGPKHMWKRFDFNRN